jgi:predicted nucleotide-binding protein
MTLPIRTLPEDVTALCSYLVKKPTGVTLAEARRVLDARVLDGRKLNALKLWGLIDEAGDRLKVTPEGRTYANGDAKKRKDVLAGVIQRIGPYFAVIERAANRGEDSTSATDVAAHWHEHFEGDVGDSDKILNDQAVCFFQIAAAAGLGEVIVGRRGMPTRLQLERTAVEELTGAMALQSPIDRKDIEGFEKEEQKPDEAELVVREQPNLGQGIFVAHGKNKRPLEQLKKILDQFKIPYRVAVDEPNLGRPIGAKVKETMEACNCAVLIFTADEEFRKADGASIWRPSANVVYELGASSYLYANRIVIVKEDGVEFPSNFRDLGHISFEKDNLEAKSMDVLRELIGFGIVKIST